MAARFGISPELSPTVLLLLAIGVSFVVVLVSTITRERVFVANLGVSRLTLFLLAFCTVVVCEILLAGGPSVISHIILG